MKTFQVTFLSLLLTSIASVNAGVVFTPDNKLNARQNFANVVRISAGFDDKECVKATDRALGNGSPIKICVYCVYFICMHNSY